jgi:hypothetical protein
MASTLQDSGPADFAVAVTPSDSANLPNSDCVALYIGTAGTLRVMCSNGQDCVFAATVAGVLPLKVRRVYATGTTATNIVAMY